MRIPYLGQCRKAKEKSMLIKDLLIYIFISVVEYFTQTTEKSEIVEETEISNKTQTEKSSDENYSQTTAPNLSEELEITNPTTTTKSSDGLLDREIVIYSLVIACIIVILGLSYLVQKYRKKTINDPRHNTVQRTHSNGRDSFVDSNSSIYDEIDETMLVENASINVLKNEISLNTDNTSYLYPIHQEDDKKAHQNHNSDESDKNDDTTSYLHPYNTVDEDWKGKTQQYDEAHVSNKDTDDSSESSTYMNNDGYLNPYQPLNKEWKQTFHSYEVPVTVHHCQISSAVPSVLDNDLYENGNGDNDVAHTSEAVISTCKNRQWLIIYP
ncbi:unnamed protein product [Mytilus edulis]|uniref:Uncharacterized protein n=1 Tax=Mytilus edulis TaxID=6550 RepID=A0A8S3R4D8_MYTED|nr:unnamed protein product [Mytilus edulis]